MASTNPMCIIYLLICPTGPQLLIAHGCTISPSDMVPPGDWAFGFSVTTEQVWDAFVILALLEDHQSQSKTFAVPHIGAQKNCLTNVLHA